MIDRDSQMSQIRETGAKGKHFEEMKEMNASNLITTFCYKSDMYNFFSKLRKKPHFSYPMLASSIDHPERR